MYNFCHLHFIADVYSFRNFDFHFTDLCLCRIIFIFTTSLTTASTISDSESTDSEEVLSENEDLGLDEEIEDDESDWEDASSDDDGGPHARRVRQEWNEGYDIADPYKLTITLTPRRHPEPQLADRTRQDAMLWFSKEEDFFKLFFSDMIS